MSPPPSSSPQPDQNPSPTPSPETEELVVTPPGFATFPAPATTSSSPNPPPPQGDGFAGDWPPEIDGTTGPSTRSSPASTDGYRPITDDVDLAAVEGYRAMVTAMAEQIVVLSSTVVRAVRARRRQLPLKAWQPTKSERKAIAEPLARIAVRHAPMTGEGSDDLVDGFTAGVATIGYTLKQLELENPDDVDDAGADELPNIEDLDAGAYPHLGTPPASTFPFPR